ncbi:hypothetical protein EJB05_22234, partial [Eragrostis curvula]
MIGPSRPGCKRHKRRTTTKLERLLDIAHPQPRKTGKIFRTLACLLVVVLQWAAQHKANAAAGAKPLSVAVLHPAWLPPRSAGDPARRSRLRGSYYTQPFCAAQRIQTARIASGLGLGFNSTRI